LNGDDPLAIFLREPRRVRRDTEGDLFEKVVAWTCAKLVSTLPTKGGPLDPFVDPAVGLSGELKAPDLSATYISLRLSMEASDLRRNRNIWPAANTILAWNIAHLLVSDRQLTLVLACANVSFEDLLFPKLKAGAMCLGPTFFGFRLNESAVRPA
jgi:hypothetical protein